MANSFCDYEIQISSTLCTYFPNNEKLKSFVETFTTFSQILIFDKQLWIFIFDTDHAQINSVWNLVILSVEHPCITSEALSGTVA